MIECIVICTACVLIFCSWHYHCAEEEKARQAARQHRNECTKQFAMALLQKENLTKIEHIDFE